MNLIELRDVDALRDHLDALNEAGSACETAGVDADGSAFLTGLIGPYAENAFVIYLHPWDTEASIDGAAGERCDECGGSQPIATIDHLHYPVTVVVAAAAKPGGSR